MRRFYALGALALCAFPAAAYSELILGLSVNNQLVTYDTATNSLVGPTIPVQGAGLLGIDFRPATGQLYGVGLSAIPEASLLYTIDPATGQATLVAPLTPDPTDTTNPFALLGGLNIGFDFNPIPDRIRITTPSNFNYRVNPNNGQVITDVELFYNAGDLNAFTDPNIVGSAYTNSFAGATTTTLYDIDSALDILATQNPPNDGILNTVGPLNFNTEDIVGFDISGATGIAYAALLADDTPGVPDSATIIATINLTTGAATTIGFPGGISLRDIAVIPEPGAIAILLPAALLFARRRG